MYYNLINLGLKLKIENSYEADVSNWILYKYVLYNLTTFPSTVNEMEPSKIILLLFVVGEVSREQYKLTMTNH